MENSLKQRIIGAVVLIALAIIFLPAILKDKVNSGTFESQIPAQPEDLANYQVDTQKIDQLLDKQKGAKNQSLNEKERVENKQNVAKEQSLKQDKQVEKSSSSTEISSRKTKQNKPPESKIVKSEDIDKSGIQKEASKISEKYRDAAWVIQVASFSKQSNARKMVNRLKENNYKAYRRKVLAGSSEVFRVFVGPYIEKSTAQKALSTVSKLSESNAILKPFDPIKH